MRRFKIDKTAVMYMVGLMLFVAAASVISYKLYDEKTADKIGSVIIPVSLLVLGFIFSEEKAK